MEAKPMDFPVGTQETERFDRVPSLGEIGLDHFAPYLINRISARWNIDLQGQIKVHGLTTLQMRVLAILTVMAGSTVNEVAVFAVTEQSTMSRTLDGMERDGLVRRRNRRGDARVRELHLTEKGREAFREVWPVMYESLKRMFAGFSDAEYETLIGLLTRVLRNVRRHDF
ncbi:MarR family winged helix-turn-helix transcriptional regulator [Microbaculum sp. FT89]|uniref:MarR family winged helix-turn-helix transcriptional regulator n=1 Tax=Microbaculum sp. FT89 TaxID=3447298 RepID=UPI003F53D04F